MLSKFLFFSVWSGFLFFSQLLKMIVSSFFPSSLQIFFVAFLLLLASCFVFALLSLSCFTILPSLPNCHIQSSSSTTGSTINVQAVVAQSCIVCLKADILMAHVRGGRLVSLKTEYVSSRSNSTLLRACTAGVIRHDLGASLRSNNESIHYILFAVYTRV